MTAEKIIFSDTRKTETIELPSFPGSEVVVFKDLNVGQQRAISNATDNFARAVALAKTAIKSWNMYIDDTTPLEISEENLNRFPLEDLILIFATFSGKTPEELMQLGESKISETVKKNTVDV